MEYRNLGKDGPKVSAIGFGCWEMGGQHYGGTDDAEVTKAVHRAIDLGVTLYDTAPNYGFGGSEMVLGKALGARRKDIFLVSKTCITWDPVTHTSKFDGRYSAVKRLNEESLKRLGTDHLDLLLIHWPDPETPIAETMKALEELRQEGKALNVGVSNYTSYELTEARKGAPITANQVGYNLFDRRWERQMFPTAQELGIGIMAYGPMAHGLLTGAFTPETRFVDWDWRSRGSAFGQALFTPENFPANVGVADQLKAVAARLGTTLPKLAIAWVLQHPAVAVALSGCRTVGEIEENVTALEVKIPDDALARIEEIMQGAAGQVDQVPGRHHQPPENA